jgi:hypothetical protein
MQTSIDLRQMYAFSTVMTHAPDVFLQEVAKAFKTIGTADMTSLRGKLPGRLTIRAKGLAKSFKSKATDPSRATDMSKLFLSEYTGWKAAKIFEEGGEIVGHGKNLTVLADAARGPSGKRKYTQGQIRTMIAEGKLRPVPTPRGILLVQSKGGLTKKGKPRKGAADIIIAVLRRKVHEEKRLDFMANFNSNNEQHQEAIEYAIENTLAFIAQREAGGK